jgi:hypothetical protein
MRKSKPATVWIVAHKQTGEWIVIADSLPVADAYIIIHQMVDTAVVQEVDVLTRADIDPVRHT